MMYSNQCPCCLEQNCFETASFVISTKRYYGIKCTKCSTMLYSYEDEREKEMQEFKERVNRLSAYDAQ